MRSRYVATVLLVASACQTARSTSGQALSPLQEAQLLLQQGKAHAALPQLERLHAEKPLDLTIARLLAEAHVRSGTGAALLARLSSQGTATSHYLRGLVLFAQSAETAPAALSEFRRCVALSPSEPEYHYRLGLALLESEQDSQALASLRRALELESQRPAWHLPLAKALFRTGDTKGAVESLRHAISESPSAGELATAQGLMRQISDPFSAAPHAIRPQLERAMQWLAAADIPQDAIVGLEDLRQEYPDLSIIHTMLGLAWARLDDVGRAVDEFRIAIELAPADGKNHLYLGELYLARQKPRLAQAHLQLAVERNPLLEQAWAHLGDLALQQQNLPLARENFRLASRLAPETETSRAKLALVYQLERDWAAANRELHVLLKQAPESLEYQLRLGLLHADRALKSVSLPERKEAVTEASRWLTRVLERQPENALASRTLERIRRP